MNNEITKEITIGLRLAGDLEMTCDWCESQEGSHYCLLHSIFIKNMDLNRCNDFKKAI